MNTMSNTVASDHHSEPQSLKIMADDGFELSALRYPALGTTRGHLIVAGATGVAQHFYKHFAQFAARRGYTTLTLDYRGIGLSKPTTLRGFRMHYLDWARFDLKAAVDAIPEDGMPLFMVGHSFGGHAFGLLSNHHRVSRFYTFGTGAGWHGWMPRGEQVKVLLMWRIIGPLLTRWKGYLAWSRLGFGEDLPLGVYLQWKRWCQYPRYFFDDPHMHDVQDRFDTVNTPMMAANATDDLWAMPASRDAFMSAYRNAPMQAVNLEPHTDGLKAIGHMGYFRRQAQPLWETTLQWFDQHQAQLQTR